ncbi:hypothetical protein SAMN02799622_00666 [Methylobacterium sp. UNC378MF]|jgi:hypothetical protein|nr:hypothetical protein SAMN02799622_00666 [Methylobacterium sp. UNC378MF]
MPKRRDPGRSPPPGAVPETVPLPVPETVPDRDAVERALETALDRLRPKPGGTRHSGPPRAGSDRKTRPDGAGR